MPTPVKRSVCCCGHARRAGGLGLPELPSAEYAAMLVVCALVCCRSRTHDGASRSSCAATITRC